MWSLALLLHAGASALANAAREGDGASQPESPLPASPGTGDDERHRIGVKRREEDDAEQAERRRREDAVHLAEVQWAYSPLNPANAPSDTFTGGGSFDGAGASDNW